MLIYTEHLRHCLVLQESRVWRRRTVSARSLVTGMVPCSEFLVSLLPHIISSADQLHLSERFNEGHP